MRQTQPTHHFVEPERASTGSVGLDDILEGGFDPDRVYLIEGRPGTGKTTLALQFLLEGVRRGERLLMISVPGAPSTATPAPRRVRPQGIAHRPLRRNPISQGVGMKSSMVAQLVPRTILAGCLGDSALLTRGKVVPRIVASDA